MGLSRRAYARHRGVSDMAVRKAIASGRIGLEADGTIDPGKADLAWDRHSDPAQARAPVKASRGAPRPVTVAQCARGRSAAAGSAE